MDVKVSVPITIEMRKPSVQGRWCLDHVRWAFNQRVRCLTCTHFWRTTVLWADGNQHRPVRALVRDGTSAKALHVVCWSTGLQIAQTLWNGYTAHAVMFEFKAVWVKHYGWPEILVHDQGREFMGSEFQNPAGAAGVLTMPIDSLAEW